MFTHRNGAIGEFIRLMPFHLIYFNQYTIDKKQATFIIKKKIGCIHLTVKTNTSLSRCTLRNPILEII